MGFPSLGSLFQVGVPMLTGHLQGQLQGQELLRKRQLEDEDRAREAQMDALQRQLLETQINKAQHPPKPWEAAGFSAPEEQLGYLESLQRIQNPRLTPWEESGFGSEQDYLGYLGRKKGVERDDRTPWEEAGFGDEQSYLRYLEAEGKAKYPDRYDGPGGGGTSDITKRNGFLWNYLMQTGKGRMDPRTFEWVPPAPPEERIREGVKAWNELQRLTDPEYNPADDMPAGPPEGWHPPMAPDFDPSAGLEGEESYDPADYAADSAAADVTRAAAGAPNAPAAPRPGGMGVADRIAQLKRSGMSKEQAYQVLQQEGYLDAQGNIIGE
jgi:hypothetical protein